MAAYCTCAEARLSGGDFFQGPHDCLYIKRRNSLLPKAESAADKACTSRNKDGTAIYGVEWMGLFLREMDRLYDHHYRGYAAKTNGKGDAS